MRPSYLPKIVFQDEDIFVIDKPAGWVVNRAESTKNQLTIQDWIEKKGLIPKVKGEESNAAFYQRSGVVHRLDKETSGLLLAAKNPAAFQALQKQFKERKVQKNYLALVHGRVRPETGFIEAPISRSPFNREKFGVFLGGRTARTEYQLKAHYQRENETYSLVGLRLLTGRTHQIRIHMKYFGYPVVADEKYGGRKTSAKDRKWCERQFLHAQNLAFTHPKTGKRMDFSSSLPDDLKQALKKCKLLINNS